MGQGLVRGFAKHCAEELGLSVVSVSNLTQLVVLLHKAKLVEFHVPVLRARCSLEQWI